MSELAIILGLIFMFFCIVVVMLHSMRLGRVTLLDWALLGIGGIYGGGWALVVFITGQGGNPVWSVWILPFEHLFPIHTLYSFLLAVCVVIGWLLINPFVNSQRNQGQIRCLAHIESRLIKMMWLLFTIAFVTQWLYTYAYGGFVGMLEYSSAIRSAVFDEVPANFFSFLKPFGGFALLASFGFFGLWLHKPHSMVALVGLVLSFLFSIYLLYSWLGRIEFLVYLATFVLGIFLYRSTRPLSVIVKGGVTMFLILIAAYFVSTWLELKSADNLSFFLARELSFPFGSFFAQLDSGEHLFRGFIDFLVSPMYLLPSSWWSGWFENVSQVNTRVIMGAPKGEQGVTGGIPVDLLTLGIMQASVFGVAIVGIMFGILLRVIQHLIDRLSHKGVRSVFEAYVALKVAVLGVFYAQPELFISSNFALLVMVALFFVFLNKKRLRFFSMESRVNNMPTHDFSNSRAPVGKL